jgi:hypothetical protein
VAYDEDFAAHVRELRSGLGAVGECRVFDGRAFLIGGRRGPCGWIISSSSPSQLRTLAHQTVHERGRSAVARCPDGCGSTPKKDGRRINSIGGSFKGSPTPNPFRRSAG